MKKIIASAVIVTMLSACATRPENVNATHVSSLKYENTACKRLAVEMDDINAKLATATAALDSKATTDAVLMGVGMIIFWPALLGAFKR
jgi:starvation-inducible outer membrane lipoprotein